MGRRRLTVEDHLKRGTYRHDRHNVPTLPTRGVVKESDPRTWFRHWQPFERYLWRQYLAKYVPGDRQACYRFIAWQSACWPEPDDPPEDADTKAYHARKMAEMFKATKWRKR